MKIINTLLVLFVLCVFPVLALAGDELKDPVAAQVINHAVEIAAAALMLFATWAAHKVSGWLKSKTGVEVDSLLESYAAKGVTYAEEKAHQVVSAKKKALKGPEKLEMALGFALDLAESNKLPEKAKDKLVQYIEAKLGETRAS